MKILHCCANNDVNGNPRRVFVLVNDNEDNCILWDEGYSGHHAVPPMYRQLACESERVTVSARKYMKLLKDYPTTNCWFSPGEIMYLTLRDSPSLLLAAGQVVGECYEHVAQWDCTIV